MSIMSNPTIEEAFEEASSTLQTQSVTPEPEAPQAEPTPPVQAESQPSEPKEEGFTRVDPNSLPEELKGIYKSLLSDYTKKRQVESKRVKDLEAELEQLKVSPQPQAQPANQPRTFKTVEEYNAFMEQRAREIAEQTFKEQQESMYDQQAQTELPSLDDRLKDDNPITYDIYLDSWLRDRLTGDLEAYVAEHGTKIGFDWKSQAKEYIEKWDNYLEEKFKQSVQRQSQLAKENSEKLRKSGPEVSKASGTPSSKMSIDDAIADAIAKHK